MDHNAIDKMTQQEKLRAMEALWDSLTHGETEPLSPAWHEEVLANRKAKMDAGEATFITLDDLKATTPE
jgi:putative addiction module component (TIGR02574 family)